MFSTETIAALAVGALLAIAIPVAAVIVFKRKYRDSWLPSVFIGAGTFIVFALILESICHQVMIPLVNDSVLLYGVYGALAAGVFEETGRLVAYKTLMKKHFSTKNAVLMGLGHGGIEAVIALGSTLFAFMIMAIMANSMGFDKLVETFANGNAETADAIRTQLGSVKDYNFLTCVMGVYERIVAMTFHTCMSVFVYKAVSQKGRMWLYPAAILIHALVDFPVALCQKGIIDVVWMYVIFTAAVAVIIIVTVVMAKKMPDNEVKQR